MYGWNELVVTLDFHLYRFATELQAWAYLAMEGTTKAGSKERSEYRSTYKSST